MDKFFNIKREADGVYRWTYDLNMWTNATLYNTLIKVGVMAVSVPTLLMGFLTLVEQGPLVALRVTLQIAGLVGLTFAGLILVSYCLLALLYKGKYRVSFEMDDKGIRHVQVIDQLKQAKVLSAITAVFGLIRGNAGVTGAGLLALGKTSSYADFSKVAKVKASPKRHVIYLRSGLNHNQVYVDDKDFWAVHDFIESHCDKVKVKK